MNHFIREILKAITLTCLVFHEYFPLFRYLIIAPLYESGSLWPYALVNYYS